MLIKKEFLVCKLEETSEGVIAGSKIEELRDRIDEKEYQIHHILRTRGTLRHSKKCKIHLRTYKCRLRSNNLGKRQFA